jgi:hypothetical protein
LRRKRRIYGRRALSCGSQAGVERVLRRGLAAGDVGCGRRSETRARALLGGQALAAGDLTLGVFALLLLLELVLLLVVRSAAAAVLV